MADDTKNLLKALEEARAARSLTIEELESERKLSIELVRIARDKKLVFDETTRSIGSTVKQLTTEQKIVEDINRTQFNTNGLERQLENLLKQKVATKNYIKDLDSRSEASISDEITKLDKILFTDKLRAKYTDEEIAQKENLRKQLLHELDYKNEILKGHRRIGHELDSEIKKTAKTLEKERSRLEIIEKQKNELDAQNNIIDKLGGGLFQFIKNSSISKAMGLDKFVEKLPKEIQLAIATITKLIGVGFENFTKLETAAFDIRKNFGLMRNESANLQKNTLIITSEFAGLGVTFESVARATNAIGNDFNRFTADNKNLVEDVSILSAQLGIAESDSSKFLKTMSSIGNTTAASQKGMIGFAKQMSYAAGVPLPAVMKDVAEASDDVRIFTGKSVDNLIKGSIQARQMGTTLQNMANSAKKMLDFQTSISDEMEASVLLGKDVNFEQARNLAYRKDIVGANQEILNVAKKINFDAMDPYQAEAFAKASGKSVQELQEMLQADKEIEYIRTRGTVEQKAQLEKMDKMKRMRADEAKDVGKMAEQRLREQANQERTVVLQNKFNQLMMQLSEAVLPTVDLLLSGLIPTVDFLINGGAKILALFFAIKGPITSIAKKFRSIGGFMLRMGSSMKWIKPILNLGKMFSRFAGPIGIVITLFSFATNLFKRWGEFIGKDGIILGGLKAIGYALYDTLLGPFVDAYDWIKEKLCGNSPSEIGLGILDGIKSVSGMLLDAITLPFRTAFNFISGLFGGPKLPKMSDVVFGSKEETTGGTAKGSDLGAIIAEGNKQVVAKLDELITLMSTGGIAVNIDGSKASMLLARAQKERGAFGAV